MTDYVTCRPGLAVAQHVLDAVARRAAEGVDGVAVLDRRLRRERLVSVAADAVSASLELSVRYGIVMPEAAEQARQRVGEALAHATGLAIAQVDVAVVAVV